MQSNKVKRTALLVSIITIIVCAAIKVTQLAAEPVKSAKSVETYQAFDRSPAAQLERARIITALKKENIIYDIRVSAGQYLYVYVKSGFYSLAFTEKEVFISMILAYYMVKNNVKDIVTLFDCRTNKNIGTYSKYGLKLK